MMAKHQTIERRDGESVRVTGPATITVRIPRGKNRRRVRLEVQLDEIRVERVKGVDAAPPRQS